VVLKLERGTWHAGPLFDGTAAAADAALGAAPPDDTAAAEHVAGPRIATQEAAQGAACRAGGDAAGGDAAGDFMDFVNLELSDTNVVDHNTHDYASAQGWRFVVEGPA
jgi:hypothetical protein